MGGRDGCLYCLSSLSAGTCDWWLDNIGNDFHHWFSFVTSPCPRPSCCPLLCWLGFRRHWHCPLQLKIRLPFIGKICICRKFSASAGHQFYPAGHHVLYIATFHVSPLQNRRCPSAAVHSDAVFGEIRSSF